MIGPMRILLVDDSRKLVEQLCPVITRAGYGVDSCGTIADCRDAMQLVHYALIVMDLGLPDGDGLDAIRDLRARGQALPILIMSARAGIDDRITALDAGADDYLVKPFNFQELIARIRTLLRRAPDLLSHAPAIAFSGLTCRDGDIVWQGRRLKLRPCEYLIVGALLSAQGRLVSRSSLLETISVHGRSISENAVEAGVSRARKAIADLGCPLSIETQRGLGYRLLAP